MSESALHWEWGLTALRLGPSALGLSLAAGRWSWVGAVWLAVLVPLAAPIGGPADAPLWLRAAYELCVGVAMAFSLCAPLWAAREGGRLLELGWGGQTASGVLQRLFGTLALSLFVSLGGLRLWSRSLLEASALRLDPALSLPEVGIAAAGLAGELVRLSLAVAAPAWIAFVLLDVSLALVGRLSGGPGRAIVGLSMPLRLVSLAIAVPFSADHWPHWWRASAAATVRLIQGWTA